MAQNWGSGTLRGTNIGGGCPLGGTFAAAMNSENLRSSFITSDSCGETNEWTVESGELGGKAWSRCNVAMWPGYLCNVHTVLLINSVPLLHTVLFISNRCSCNSGIIAVPMV